MNQLDLETAKGWLAKSEKAREKDPKYDEMVRLINRVWDQFQVDFINSQYDLEHPFLKRTFVKKELERYDEETLRKVRERLL